MFLNQNSESDEKALDVEQSAGGLEAGGLEAEA